MLWRGILTLITAFQFSLYYTHSNQRCSHEPRSIFFRQDQKIELELRKQKRALEDREKQRDLEIARTLDDERRKIQDETIKRIEEQHRLKDAEKEKKLQDAIKANEELSRKLQQ